MIRIPWHPVLVNICLTLLNGRKNITDQPLLTGLGLVRVMWKAILITAGITYLQKNVMKWVLMMI